MPTYEYECVHCGHRFDAFQKMTDKPLKVCPKCHKGVRRLIGSGAGIIFKGPGFYATDYRKSGPSSGTPKREAPGPACSGKKDGCEGCKNK